MRDPVPPQGAAAAGNGPPPVDWTGQPLDCTRCPHAALLREGGCAPAHACVFDRYARRIDRFLRWNPHLADGCLDHPYFEVRAIACRHGDLFRVRALAADPDEAVRLAVALRLPQRQLLPLARDPEREVRVRVAQRLAARELVAMIDDPDYYVRVLVARRLPLPLLPRMRDDADTEVRLEVARRLPPPSLWPMAADADVAVRRIVARRLPPALRARMQGDDAWQVRWELAQCGDAALVRALVGDPEPDVATAAQRRLQQLHDDRGQRDHG